MKPRTTSRLVLDDLPVGVSLVGKHPFAVEWLEAHRQLVDPQEYSFVVKGFLFGLDGPQPVRPLRRLSRLVI